MPTKRAQLPEEPFARRPTALEKLTGATSAGDGNAKAESSNTVSPSHREAATRQKGPAPVAASAGKGATEKVSFYLRPDQVDKLDELALAYKKRTGARLNRNELVRLLIDLADLPLLLAQPERQEGDER